MTHQTRDPHPPTPTPGPNAPRFRGGFRAARAIILALLLPATACGTLAVETEPYTPSGTTPTTTTRETHAPRTPTPGEPHGVYWLVTYGNKSGVPEGDANARFGLDRVGIRTDIIILYQWQLGDFPYEGPHRLLRDPAWLNKHLAEVRTDVQRWVPADFTGVVVIDYELWGLAWEHTINRASRQGWDAHDRDHKDDWIDALRATTPSRVANLSDSELDAFAKQSYDAAAKRIYLETLAAARAVRPRARWGYFHFPRRLYVSSMTPKGTVGYPDASANSDATRINDELAWLFDAVDVVLPAPYAPRITTTDAEASRLKLERNERQAPGTAERFYRSNIREAVRVARGKPVLPLIRLRYYQDDETWLRTPDLELPLRAAKEEGAAGLIMWEHITSPTDDVQLRTFADTLAKPEVARSPWGSRPGGSSD